jgi:hypothetical protein
MILSLKRALSSCVLWVPISAAEHQGSVSIASADASEKVKFGIFEKLLSGYPGQKVQRFDDGIGVVSDQVFCALPACAMLVRPCAHIAVDALIQLVA